MVENTMDNAKYIFTFFKEKGWTAQSICGMLGNLQGESGIIADKDEIGGGGGYGLVQWTPKSNLVNWANANGLNYRELETQCKRIQWELDNGQQFYATGSFPLSFTQFTKSTQSPTYLANVFIHNYERPANTNQPQRGVWAEEWYRIMQSSTPEPPFIPEQIIPVGGISVGTNVFYQQGKLTNSAEKIPGNAVGGTGNAWVKSYLPSKTSPYLLMKDGINIGYTQREYISRVNQLPANGILEGTNVFCNLISDNQDTSPSKSTGYQSFWVAQYVDGNKKSPYRLVKDGVTKGFTNRDNIAKV
ncbi:phage tail tip lysozyme [Carnobacterium sp.]|uniref:phage tail tip lysozyme n=1 Tax=Carnobacterium sp. TaxID=48221 RepID=UPI002FCC2B61